MEEQKITQTWKSAAALTFVATLIINAMAASTDIIGGITTKSVSDMYDNLFTPAGFTFAIWSVIYTLLILFVLRALNVWSVKNPGLDSKSMSRVIQLFTYTNIINVAWILAWQYQAIWLTLPLMLALLVLLVKIHGIVSTSNMSIDESIVLRAPFSLYFGWITVATIANFAVYLTSIGWQGGGISPETWMLIIPAVGACIALTVAFIRSDILYLGVLLWAYNGIASRYAGNAVYSDIEISLRLWMIVFGSVVIVLALKKIGLIRWLVKD